MTSFLYRRTSAADFESKIRARKGEGWGTRNANLRLSCKALFARDSSPCLAAIAIQPLTMIAYLDERMSVPPLDRIADAFIDHSAPDPGARTLNACDEFLAPLDDSDQRKQRLGLEEARESRLFTRIAELGKEFEAGLLTLLFDDPELRRWVRDYLIF